MAPSASEGASAAANPRPTPRLPTTHPLPTLALYALPLLVSLLRLNPVATLALLAVAAAARAAQGFAAFAAPPTPVYVLESISISHYVETVRWALDRLGVAYAEAESVGVVGALLFQRLVPTLHVPASQTRVSDSSTIMDHLYARHMRDGSSSFLRPIARAEDVELETMVLRLGVVVRKWAYYHVIEGSPDAEMLLRLWGVRQPNVPRWQVAFINVTRPLACRFIMFVAFASVKSACRNRQSVHAIPRGNRELTAWVDRRCLLSSPCPTEIA